MADHNLTWAYDKTRLVVLPVDPYRIYAYWEVPSEIIKATQEEGGDTRAVLRFCKEDKAPAENRLVESFEIEIDLQSANWYVPLWTAEETYRVDLALKRKDGNIIPLGQPQLVQMPRTRPTSGLDESFMSVDAAQRRAEIVHPVPPRQAPAQVYPHVERKPATPRRLIDRVIQAAEIVKEKLHAVYRSLISHLPFSRRTEASGTVPESKPESARMTSTLSQSTFSQTRSAGDLTTMAEAKLHSAVSSDAYQRRRKETGSDNTE
jgi:hypothetical protein